ncbi:MAG TPA: protein phosphatase 2C domain-containing protein [Ktedonobacteraceae bacterium]|jgi:serine/threonine protein phosphatase PrpC|nr:protein phosphatase 2C domain-containing protein [Ktedonobacteraceae bacterium]
MRVSSYITKLWREVFGQESLEPEHAQTQISPDWIRARVHAALAEETFQAKGDEMEQQPSWSSTLLSPPSPVNVEPMVGLPAGGGMNVENRFKEQRSEDCAPHLLVGWRSDPGLERRHKPNEDSLFAARGTRLERAQSQDFGLFIVADGMGGHAFGQEAGHLAIQTMIEWVLPRMAKGYAPDKIACREVLILGVQAANRELYRRNKEQGTQMGTTVNAVLILEGTAFIANVGDSRTYLYREASGLRKVTRDHSLVAYLVESGIIQPDDIYRHPQRNRIYRSLGSEPFIPVDAFIEPLQPGDTLILCSDGLWEMVRDLRMQEIVRQAPVPSQASHMLVDAALQEGGTDNVSVIVVRVTEPERCGGESGLQLLVKPETVEIPHPFPRELKRSL